MGCRCFNISYAEDMPTALLRPIAIYVEEPTPGQFVWALMERKDSGTWAETQRSALAAGTYHQAMADGLVVLQSMIDDLDIGPRRPLKRAKVARQPSDDARATDRPETEPPAPSRTSLFGFGPAR